MLHQVLSAPGRRRIVNAPEGLDALLIAQALAAAPDRPHLHIARDDQRMTRLAEAVSFFAPKAEVLLFPAWDCLPYDRVSPHRDIVARRLATLTRLRAERETADGLLVVTTVSALMQRVLPGDALSGRTLDARPGDRLAVERLTAFFADNGYLRVETVGEPGEYALRGGLLDVFPPGAEQPLRLDFFGDELESIRSFDPLTQISSGPAESLSLKPVSEVLLEPDSIERFRSGYRKAFGAQSGSDPLYESVSAGRPHPGMEHWLPLFYERLETLFDYLPGAAVTLDHQAEETKDTRLETIADFYDARQTLGRAEAATAGVYNPLPPAALYLTEADWSQRLEARATGDISPFAGPEDLAGIVDAGGRRAPDFAAERLAGESQLYDAVKSYVEAEQKAGRRVLLVGYSRGSRDRLAHVLADHGLTPQTSVETWGAAQQLPAGTLGVVALGLERGFGTSDLTVLTEADVLGERIARAQARRRRPENFLTEVSTLAEGDHVVHVEFGIGRYESLETLDIGGAAHDCLRVIYHGGDKLYVPVENIEVLSRFGGEEATVELDRLGQGGWQARKARVKERIREIADELIKIAAERELRKSEAVPRPDGLYEEFAARFPYPETDDQLRAIEDTLADLNSGKPMDRLVCGDVGFGKTEIALRAAFVSALNGHQVAIAVPTTLLARQHFATVKARFAGLPVRVGQLSRLVTTKDANKVKKELEAGTIDIVVGTHALLSDSVKFKDLGLMIVDEEQHFGVKQKERLKQLRAEVHVLTLTATPIPRTLQLALSGVKEMSLIATPPVDRLAVRTFVLPYDPVVVREAILREYHRGGQSFYVCPRIEDLDELRERLTKLVPEVKVAVAHGRMAPSRLEETMTDFVDRKFDLLLSTNIVESGLDIPTANTMIIHRADMFGLSQLYQLRGRIGRGKQRGYAYLTLPPGRILSNAAEKRLHVMQTLDTLGAGFTLASHDLDIRGAGNLLGEEQSGHIREVGIELYQQMLEEAVAAARESGSESQETTATGETWAPQINLGTAVLIPEVYVPDLHVRLGLYRRLSQLVDKREIDAFAAELVDRFGPLPEEVQNLLDVIAIKQLCRDAGVEKVDAGPKGAVIAFRGDLFANPQGLVQFIQSQAGTVKLRPDHKLVYKRGWDGPQQRMRGVRRLLEQLGKAAAQAA